MSRAKRNAVLTMLGIVTAALCVITLFMVFAGIIGSMADEIDYAARGIQWWPHVLIAIALPWTILAALWFIALRSWKLPRS